MLGVVMRISRDDNTDHDLSESGLGGVDDELLFCCIEIRARDEMKELRIGGDGADFVLMVLVPQV